MEAWSHDLAARLQSEEGLQRKKASWQRRLTLWAERQEIGNIKTGIAPGIMARLGWPIQTDHGRLCIVIPVTKSLRIATLPTFRSYNL